MFKCEAFFDGVVEVLEALGFKTYKTTSWDRVGATAFHPLGGEIRLSAGDAGFETSVTFFGKTPLDLALQRKVRQKYAGVEAIIMHDELHSSNPEKIAHDLNEGIRCYDEWRKQTEEVNRAIMDQIQKTVDALH